MRKRAIAATLLLGAVAVSTAILSAQSNGQVMSGLTLQPIPMPAPKPFTLRLPAPDGQNAKSLQAEAVKRLQAEMAKHKDDVTPTIVCGMTVIKADPSFDAAIRRTPPTDRAFTLRIIQPTVCASDK